jgi:hypothetical protein
LWEENRQYRTHEQPSSHLEVAALPRLSRFSVVVASAYAATIFAAKMVTALVDARWSVGSHVAILWVLLFHSSGAKTFQGPSSS